MAYFHSRTVANRGGKASRPMRRLCGETLEEMRTVARLWPEAVTINWPDRRSYKMRGRSRPEMWIDANSQDILDEIGSDEVPESYISVLSMMNRAEYHREHHAWDEEAEKYFTTEVRGKLIQLLRYGDWIDEPMNHGLKTLNSRLEKIDLGRRSDLKFSSSPLTDGRGKYDRDFQFVKSGEDRGLPLVTPQEEELPDFELLYRDGSPKARSDLLTSRPWMRSMLVEKYGEPEKD